MPDLTFMFIEFIIMTAILVAVWWIGKQEGVNGEKVKTADKRADAISRGLRAGKRARDKFDGMHK